MFGKLRSSSQQNQQGIGLGLNICKRIVNEYGGNIQVESEYGKGTKFSFNMIVKSFTHKVDFEAQSEQLTGRRQNYPLINNSLRMAHKNIIDSTARDEALSPIAKSC